MVQSDLIACTPACVEAVSPCVSVFLVFFLLMLLTQCNSDDEGQAMCFGQCMLCVDRVTNDSDDCLS